MIPLTLFESFAHRLQCLSLDVDSSDEYDIPDLIAFPNVKRLTFRNATGAIPLSLISITHFPALRALICEGQIISDITNSPDWTLTLEELYLSNSSDDAWLTVLRACRETLVSLGMGCGYINTPYLVTIELPMCKHLAIRYWDEIPDTWEVTLKTPVRECYTEYRYNHSIPGENEQIVHDDTAGVTRLRTDQLPPNDSAIPNLRLLEISDLKRSLPNYLDFLQSDGNTYPALERITYCSEGAELDETDLRDSNDFIRDWNQRRARPIAYEVVETWQDDMPGTIKSSCGVGLSCHDE